MRNLVRFEVASEQLNPQEADGLFHVSRTVRLQAYEYPYANRSAGISRDKLVRVFGRNKRKLDAARCVVLVSPAPTAARIVRSPIRAKLKAIIFNKQMSKGRGSDTCLIEHIDLADYCNPTIIVHQLEDRMLTMAGRLGYFRLRICVAKYKVCLALGVCQLGESNEARPYGRRKSANGANRQYPALDGALLSLANVCRKRIGHFAGLSRYQNGQRQNNECGKAGEVATIFHSGIKSPPSVDGEPTRLSAKMEEGLE